MDIGSDRFSENALTALQRSASIQLIDSESFNLPFYQWLLSRAQSGARVEIVSDTLPDAGRSPLTPRYFQHLEQAGGNVFFSKNPSSPSSRSPFILLEHAVLVPAENPGGHATIFFKLQEETSVVARYRALFSRCKESGHAYSGPMYSQGEPGNNATVHPDTAPIEIRFSVHPARVEINEHFELFWEVKNASRVFIEPLPGEVPPKGRQVLSAEKTVEFRLNATRGRQTLSSLAKVEVNPAPKIEYLLGVPGGDKDADLILKPEPRTPDRYGVVKGQALRLYWRVYNAQNVRIDGQEVPATGNMVFAPEQIRPLTISAAGNGQTVQKIILIDVFPRPEVKQIGASTVATISIDSAVDLPPLPPLLAGRMTAGNTEPPREGNRLQPQQAKTGSALRRFFWFCSGASQAILERCPAQEGNKYAGIGATVFFTGLLAALSGGYALFVAFQHATAALLFGLLWGALIFNLDRLIVSTIKKDAGSSWRPALPRFLLALALSVVIAKPMELRIFKPEIDEILSDRKRDKLRRIETQFQEQTAKTTNAIERLKAETQAGFQTREALYQEYRCECDGTCGTGKIGRGSECARKEAKYLQSDAEYQALKTENDRLIAGIRTEAAGLKKREAAALNAVATLQSDGLVARLSAAQELPFLPGFFIALLVFLVEVAPVLSKLLTPPGAYDRALQVEETRFALREEAGIQHDQTAVEQNAALRIRLHQTEVDQEVEQKREILRLIADAQVQLAQDQIDRWLENERHKLRDTNPEPHSNKPGA